MTVEEAKAEIPDIDAFCHWGCVHCNSEWYCPTYCDLLKKSRRIPFNRILACYARHEGDPVKVFNYIKQTKERLRNEL